MWIKMDEILERGLSFILLHCFVFIHIIGYIQKAHTLDKQGS